MSTLLEEFAMIGDGETVALISRRGSIDWLCLPRFDSPACCAALLGTDHHGRWSIAPEGPLQRAEHRYQLDTLVLDTDLTSAQGTIRLTDFMPMRSGPPVLVRIVTGLSGDVAIRLEASFRFDYGKMPPWVSISDDAAVMQVGPDKLVLRGDARFEVVANSVLAHALVREGTQLVFVLSYSTGESPAPDPIDGLAALQSTQRYWRDWIGRVDRPVEHREHLRRSLLTLKALVHRPTGGLVAAPTTSLPEKPGGSMNWDYRYCWLRDATFAMIAFVECGYMEEASAWRDWVLRAVAGAPEKMQTVYRVDGSRRLDEAELPWLPGFRFARPVRIGNLAAGQLQLDVYGELIRMLHASERAGMERTAQGRHLEHMIVDHVARIWGNPDQGLWESRGEARHYTYSKVMAWVALQRFLDGKGSDELAEAKRKRMEVLRDHIHAVICSEGYDAGLGSFTSFFGGQQADASLLLLPKVGFLPVDDVRMAGTIALIETRLVVDGLVRRYVSDELVTEGAFLACSFWLAECQLRQGRREEAVRTIDRALGVGSGVGLLSEEYDIAGKRLSGNYPQALSHLAAVHAMLALEQFDRTGSGRIPMESVSSEPSPRQ
ncbi:MAG: glycoside hydrolase family 15 protein [Steroidobacteraceae bacterium]